MTYVTWIKKSVYSICKTCAIFETLPEFYMQKHLGEGWVNIPE